MSTYSCTPMSACTPLHIATVWLPLHKPRAHSPVCRRRQLTGRQRTNATGPRLGQLFLKENDICYRRQWHHARDSPGTPHACHHWTRFGFSPASKRICDITLPQVWTTFIRHPPWTEVPPSDGLPVHATLELQLNVEHRQHLCQLSC